MKQAFNKNYAYGGELQSFDSGGSHGENPLGGIPMPNNKSVEQGETKNGDYIYSDRLLITKDDVEQYGLPKRAIGKTFAQYSKSIDKKYTRENDAYEKRAKQSELDMLREIHEAALAPIQPEGEQMFLGGALAAVGLATQAAPILAEGYNAIRTARNKPEAKDINMFDTGTQFTPNLINRDQIKTDIRSNEATAAYDIRNASGGNAGRYLANRVALNNSANTNLAQANLQSDMADAGEFARVEGMNFQQDSANQQKAMQVTNWNDADIAAWEGSLQDSIAGVGQNVGNLGLQLYRNALTDAAYRQQEKMLDKQIEAEKAKALESGSTNSKISTIDAYNPTTAPIGISVNIPGNTLSNELADTTDYSDLIDTKTLQNIIGTSPDGIFGPNSVNALKQFQAKHGLPQTGIVDMETLKIIQQYIPKSI